MRPTPPLAPKIPHTLSHHGDHREDPFFWMRERDSETVLAYLNAENEYADAVMQPTEPLQNLLFEEMKARYKKDDASLPYFFNGYWYIVRYEEGSEYPIFTRKKEHLDAEEEVTFDVNILAAGHEFYDFGSASVSPDNRLAAYSYDAVGRRQYCIGIRNLVDGSYLSAKIENTTGKAVWSGDNQYIFYVKKDTNLRAYAVYRHQVGTSPNEDILIFMEDDDTFDVHIFKTKSLEYICITSSSTLSDECRFIRADEPLAEFRILQPRTEDLEYSVDHYGDYFYIITNADEATNFKLVKVPVDNPGKDHWTDIIPHREDTLLEGFELFENYLVLEERTDGLLQLNIIDNHSGTQHYLPFQDPTYTAFIGINLDFHSHLLRYGYTSLTTPSSTYEYNMKTGETVLLKQQEVLQENFSPRNYISQRLWAPSRDGRTSIPISLVYHKNTTPNADTPLLLYGYGSYGHTVDAVFSSTRLSLLDRGFIFAIAHIRGGEYLGREWYEDGKMLSKKNTFFDFIDAADFLCAQQLTSPRHLYAMGGSAGGLLVGAVANMAPDYFHGIIAQVPFVDVVTTMLDETIPLTTGEYDEWGNPNDAEYYHYMKSYSPYDNVVAQDYPHMLITTGYHDSQVQYWEPAKWTAKLRSTKTDNNLLIFKTDMSTGHGGASGRFESLREEALEYAFLLHLENINH